MLRERGIINSLVLAVAIGAGGIALAACASDRLAGDAARISQALLPRDRMVQVRDTCRQFAPALDLAAEQSQPAIVYEAAVGAQAYCAEMLAGSVPSTTDAHTPEWLDETLTGLKHATRIAGVVLPML